MPPPARAAGALLEPSAPLTPLELLASGAAAGAVSKVIAAPMDRVKVL